MIGKVNFSTKTNFSTQILQRPDTDLFYLGSTQGQWRRKEEK